MTADVEPTWDADPVEALGPYPPDGVIERSVKGYTHRVWPDCNDWHEVWVSGDDQADCRALVYRRFVEGDNRWVIHVEQPYCHDLTYIAGDGTRSLVATLHELAPLLDGQGDRPQQVTLVQRNDKGHVLEVDLAEQFGLVE